MKSKVYIIKRDSEETYQDCVKKTLKLASMKEVITNIENKILINPNWVCSDVSDTGNVTSTDTLEGIVQYLINEAEISPQKIIIADGGWSGTTRSTMELNDVFRLEEYGIKVADLNTDKRINNIRIKNAVALESINLAKIAMDASCIISVPSLKTHSMAETTLCMKNLMGSLLPKGIMHSQIHQKIVDLNQFFREKLKFNIIDGFFGSDGYEIGGSPIKMDLIIVGKDPVAVDTVGSAIIGYHPNYLDIAEKRGLGVSNLENIELIGCSIEEVYHKFY
ncbi:MAG: DUF362 domain-containing protein [Candidatus Lokiarchaeota archaeon]|nr:DUF362 domain-containing protein [Candidatus Lokiarchaeota archaeon]